MATNEVIVSVRDHCTVLDKTKWRTTLGCNYCGKKVDRISRLQQHLGGIRGEVSPCVEVPEDVKVQMRDSFTKIAHLNEATVHVREHGTLVDDVEERIRCNHCGKEIAGCNRFKQHLGGIGRDVAHCIEVPEDVKVQMRNSLTSREVRQLFEENSNVNEFNNVESIQPTLSRKRKLSPIIEHSSGSQEEGEHLQVVHYPQILNKTKNKEEAEDYNSSRQIQRCIGRFFFENGIDFSAANSPSFQKMIHSLVGGGSEAYKVPSCDDLKGWILEEELKATRARVLEVVCSWGSTGCSILLDGWTDVKGRIMINFVVDSPRGPIFLKSADCSDSFGDVEAMIALLSGVVEEVGVQNVVQIVTYNTEGSMEAVGKQMAEKYKSIFWTVCASHCIGLMLEKIGMLGTEGRVLSKAKTVTKFIYSREAVLKLMRKHIGGFDIVSSSRIRSMVPFLILERIVSQKKCLRKMFVSAEWKDSTLASTADGRKVAGLVTGDSFWTEAEMLLKASIPLMRALRLLNGGDSRPQLGYIYETMDQVKETIKEEYKGRETIYQPFWTVVDGIWDNQLHSSIHSAGYYLNPGLFYFDDFYADAEVAAGLFCCIVRIVDDKHEQDLITLQFNEYRKASGAFGDGDAVHQRTKLAPAKWWSMYGGQCPELQRLAIRILSQTCTGALRYGLQRSLTEELHRKGRNCLEQKRLNELTFVQHNLRLRNSSAPNRDYTDVFFEPIDPMDEWVGGGSGMEAEQKGLQ